MKSESIENLFLQPGPFTNLKGYSSLVESLPAEIPDLVAALQGLMVHVFWASRYGFDLSEERQAEAGIRSAERQMARLLELDGSSLDCARPLEKRLVGNCRNYSVMLAAILKAKGTPARARCGFGTYFMPDHYEDHWMTEYWHAGEQRWVQVDAQLDAVQREALRIDFNTLDMPPGKFILAGQAWQMTRWGEADPDRFGIFEWHGVDFIRGNLARDVLSLHHIEPLPWDSWGLLEHSYADADAPEVDLWDRAAELTQAGNDALPILWALYENEPRLQPPAAWMS